MEQKTEQDKIREMENYFDSLERGIKECYRIAQEARKKGLDPKDEVEVPLARNMAERVEGLISAVSPQIIGSGVSKRISHLEKKYGPLDWRIALIIADEIAHEKYCKFKDKMEAMEVGIRVGFAYLTMGTVSSPIEGFTHLKVRKRKDGKEYLAMFFSGPVRSAGGTGASVSVIIADYIRQKFGYNAFDADEKEINRYALELNDYHERITNLQYLPGEEETKFLVKNLPIQIDGDPSEKIEVSNYKDLPRIETNTIRNGVCLVLGEGIAQKAPKLWKQLSKWGAEYGLENWNFLEDFLKIQKKIKAGKSTKTADPSQKVVPDRTFIKDLVAGRPILTHPLAAGGFRLRYGRARTSGYSSYTIHPSTMAVLDKYIAIGTQLKLERPGKGATVTSCDSIEGPIVLLNNGEVKQLDDYNEAKALTKDVEKILFLGDILINYGDFFNRAHMLVPPGYCPEWWVQEVEKSIVDNFGSLDMDKASELLEMPKETFEKILGDPFKQRINAEQAVVISKKLNVALHPNFTYHWKLINNEELTALLKWAMLASIQKEGESTVKAILPLQKQVKETLENIGVPHIITNNEFIVINKDDAYAFLVQTGMLREAGGEKILEMMADTDIKDTLSIINKISEVKIRDKSGIFVGARMGRPEKAKLRELTGSPHVLFPIGEEGGRLRSFQAAIEKGEVNADFAIFYCTKCDRETVYPSCDICLKKTKKLFKCKSCGIIEKDECPKHGKADAFAKKSIDIKHHFQASLNLLKLASYPDLIKGVRGTSNKLHIPENLAKGILRASHEITVNKDGTTRYDMTQLPITHFKPREIGTNVAKLIEMGYTYDIKGRPLKEEDQVIELKVQDIILSGNADSPDLGANKIFLKIAQFMDDMLERMYGLKPFYNAKTEEDLIGHLGLVLAPHTSAATLVRIIGFSKTQGLFAHPMLHAATRRDCDGDEASVSLLLDILINFSRLYLSDHRGSTQDVCLVATSRLIPTEIDDMVFDMDTAWKYPLEFYNACLEYKMPWDVEINQVKKYLNTGQPYLGVGFTHPTTDINKGVRCSAYKTLPDMELKLKGQMALAEKIRAVDARDVAVRVIEKHFLKDIKGNLRKFSMQEFRCVKCNEKFRRPPLAGKCKKCGGKLLFTISEGSVIKYLQPSISLAEKYDVPAYLKQTLEILNKRVEGVFGKEKESQEGLGKWFG